MCDHYMAPPSLTSSALSCMQEVQEECFKLGIPLRTRHREVAPNQYEFAPLYGSGLIVIMYIFCYLFNVCFFVCYSYDIVTTQIDQNLMVMQILEEVAVKHGLAALLHEKPFQGFYH